jgi:2-hydroxy-3-oxopropionate reductase
MLVIDNSTIKPETARRVARALAEAGVDFLDAPVSGGDIGAREATLAIMVGGPRAAFERAQPLFRAIGKTITYVGESGAGQVAKACNQIMVAAQMVAMGGCFSWRRNRSGCAAVVDAIREGRRGAGRWMSSRRGSSQASAGRASRRT